MKPSAIYVGLVAAILLQLFVLSGMVVKAAMPLWTGTEIRVKTVPVDPRSMFRGNYARLNYAFGLLPEDAFGDTEEVRLGEVVYVSLQPGEGGLYEYAGASLTQPESGVFLRGRIVNAYAPYRVNYGIDAFFAPKKKALKLEQELRNGGMAVLMVTAGGRVALKDVIANN